MSSSQDGVPAPEEEAVANLRKAGNITARQHAINASQDGIC